MPASLPYLSSPGTVDTAFKRMKEAATPPRFTSDFVNSVLQMKGGTGSVIPPFLKKLGLLNADGSPSALYDQFRNDSSSRNAVADAMRIGYKPLYLSNEYVHKLNDAELKGLILQVTGLEKGNRVAQMIFGTFKKLRGHATFDGVQPTEEPTENGAVPVEGLPSTQGVDISERGVNLSYTINLNLPPTTNIEVFNAIFKSLRENLLND